MRVDDLFAFMELRHGIFLKKQAGAPKPWTNDKILQNFRFCNVYRELDTETQWIGQNWRDPNSDHPQLWFALVVARFLNWRFTLEEIGLPLPYKHEQIVQRLKTRRDRGDKIFTGAYTVSTNGRAMDKVDYVCEHVFLDAWNRRSRILLPKGITLRRMDEQLQTLNGISGFMSGQIIADLKFACGSPLHEAEDWWTWAASGPGSRRGLNRVLGRPPEQRWNEAEWHGHLVKLRESLVSRLARSKILNDDMHAQDLQNCLCEFDKYERVRLGEGRPRATYQGYV